MARPLSWSDVRGGVIATFALALIAFFVLTYVRVGALRGDTFTLYALVGEARGVLVGSEVWLSGQKIGKIVAIEFRAPGVSDTATRLAVEMQVLEEYRSMMHRDAVAQIRPGGSVIGAPVVYIAPGTVSAPPLRQNDTLHALAQADVEGAAGQFGAAAKEFPAIINNVKLLREQLKSDEGTAGAILNSPRGPGMAELSRVSAQASRLADRMQSGGGTVGRFMKGDLSSRASSVLARADSVRQLLASPNTSFGRFRRDSTLIKQVADVRAELATIRAEVDGSRGTAGRMLHDSAIGNAVIEAQRQMGLLFADIKKHPFRYLSF